MSQSHGSKDDAGFPGFGAGELVVPLFPLPNVVLFPKSVLPLHIFEERYKAMTRDALGGPRRVAMALLRPGWEKSYYGRPAIEPVVCVGKILSHEELPDGRFNFLLQGTMRARVVRERPAAADPDGPESLATDRPYRLGVLQPLQEVVTDQDAVDAGRDALHTLFAESALGQTPLGRKFSELTQSHLGTGDLTDLIAFNFVDDVPAKQRLLAETDVAKRLPMLLEALGVTGRPVVSPSVRMFKKPGMN
jgi:Lon protease-like protein